MEKRIIRTYGDLIDAILEEGLQDKEIVLGVSGYNTYCYEKGDGTYEIEKKAIVLQDINDFIVLSDECGSYEEDLYRQEMINELNEED